MAERTRHRHALIHQLLAQGHDLRAIARELKLARNTVRRFARANDPEELLVHNGTGKRPRMIEEFAGHLRRRWNQGCTNAEQLYQEIRAMGYRGAGKSVREYVRPWRSPATIASPPPSPPTVRQATGWFLRHPGTLKAGEQQHLQMLTTACPALAALRKHVRAFAYMMLRLGGDGLEQWMKRVQADDLPELHSFVAGLRRDFDAARAGLTLPYSSGKVEGHVNRIIMWNLFCQAVPIGRGQLGAESPSRTTLLTTGSKPRTGCSWLPPSGGHQHRLAEFTPDGPKEVAEGVDALLTLQFTKVDVEVDFGLRYEPEDREHGRSRPDSQRHRLSLGWTREHFGGGGQRQHRVALRVLPLPSTRSDQVQEGLSVLDGGVRDKEVRQCAHQVGIEEFPDLVPSEIRHAVMLPGRGACRRSITSASG
ncbi:hypothetical protein AB0K60_13675 [Thermopolyspora sp. NPDC052614]|uniref:hypothetical protein n=1 Tax=Thermopolyspora sp. NPDC052614 TaxID=3155682 RepID=UPI003424B1F5